MKRSVLYILLFLGNLLGMNIVFKKLNSKKIRVIMYHGVSGKKLPEYYWLILNSDSFRWQMKHLKDNYNCGDASVVLDNEPSQSINRVLITFDDGLKNNYDVVWKILAEFSLPAVCFVIPCLSKENKQNWSTEFFDILVNSKTNKLNLNQFGLEDIALPANKKERAVILGELGTRLKSMNHEVVENILNFIRTNYLDSDFKPLFELMSSSQILELSLSNEFQIASHSSYHKVLSNLSREKQKEDIALSLRNLNDLGIPFLPLFAYPNGMYNNDTIEVLKEFGFKAALIIEDRHFTSADNKFEIPRVEIGSNISRLEFMARLSGYFYFLKKIQATLTFSKKN